MRALLQRVSQAQVTVDGQVTGAIGNGFLVLLGVGPDDTPQIAERLWDKIRRLRVFDDADGKMNLSLEAVDGSVLVVSQFTLYANCRRGNRPGFTDAAKPQLANELYQHFCQVAARDVPVETGIFAAEMQVSLTNDGPITIWLDSDDLF